MLVIFCLAALLFLVRFHVADEQRTWSRHRIARRRERRRPLAPGRPLVRRHRARRQPRPHDVRRSAPLAGLWQGLDQRLVDVGPQLARFFPAGGPGTSLGSAGFGPPSSSRASGRPTTRRSSSIRTDPAAPRLKWRAVAYDRLVENQWSRSEPRASTGRPSSRSCEGTARAAPATVATQEMTYVVSGISGDPGTLVAPGFPLTVDRAARVTLVAGAVVRGRPRRRHGSYRATAAIPVVDGRRAGRPHREPAARRRHRLPGRRRGALPRPPARDGRRRGAGSPRHDPGGPSRANPYDTARAIESYLRDGANFTYHTNVLDIDCGDRGIVDCFACQQARLLRALRHHDGVMLRLAGIPARFVEGYLPGDRDTPGVETIRKANAHAWVEAYFPGYGWVDFDPTGTAASRSRAPAGPTIADAHAGPRGSGGASRPARRGRDGIDEPGGAGPAAARRPRRGPGHRPDHRGSCSRSRDRSSSRESSGCVAGSRGRSSPRSSTGRSARMAGRFGHPRRPTQTVYEYLGSLAGRLPRSVPELAARRPLDGRDDVRRREARRRTGSPRWARPSGDSASRSCGSSSGAGARRPRR